MPPSAFTRQIDAYLDGPARLRRVVADLNRQQLKARPVPGKWSTLEVVCHLVDSEQAWCHRMKRVIAEEKPLLIGYDESRFTASLGYHRHDLKSELDLLEGMRVQMAVILRDLPDPAWARQRRPQRTGFDDTRGDAPRRGRAYPAPYHAHHREATSFGAIDHRGLRKYQFLIRPRRRLYKSAANSIVCPGTNRSHSMLSFGEPPPAPISSIRDSPGRSPLSEREAREPLTATKAS